MKKITNFKMKHFKATTFTEIIPFMFHFEKHATIFGYLEWFCLHNMEISIKWSSSYFDEYILSTIAKHEFLHSAPIQAMKNN